MKLPAPNRYLSRSIVLKSSVATFCAMVLSLAPQPSFAQHAGGGGGSHGGGTSGGSHSSGGHASGSGHSGPVAGSSGGSGGVMHAGGATHSSTVAVATSNAPYAGSHIWVGSSAGSSAPSAPIERFAGGNIVWQDPPNARGGPVGNSTASAKAGAVAQNSSVVPTTHPFVVPAGYRGPLVGSNARVVPLLSTASSMRGPLLGTTQTLLPPRIFIPRPRHRFFDNDSLFFGGGCFGGFFPGFCGPALWWVPGYAWGPGCDPVFGCTGYGYSNYVAEGADQMQVQSDTPSQESGPFRWQDGPAGDSAETPAESKPAAMIYLKDGSSYGVTDYWLSGGSLHYITNYGGENSIPAERLDLQRTVDVNAAHGVSFILSNQPAPRQ